MFFKKCQMFQNYNNNNMELAVGQSLEGISTWEDKFRGRKAHLDLLKSTIKSSLSSELDQFMWRRTDVILTNDGEHAGGFGGLCITFVFSFIIKHRFVDDEDVLPALSDNFILLPLSDFTSVLKPADLRDSKWEEISERLKNNSECSLYSEFIQTNRQKLCSLWRPLGRLHIQTWQIPSLWPRHHGAASRTQHVELLTHRTTR